MNQRPSTTRRRRRLAAVPVELVTATLQPADGIDTYIEEFETEGNYGAVAYLAAGVDSVAGTDARGLLAFDLSAIPAGATIVSAVLTLVCEAENAAGDQNVSVHRALTQWYEGAQEGDPPEEDGSVWDYRNGLTSDAWAGGAGGAAGSDWQAEATDTVAITGTGAFSWDVADDVQAWVNGTANYGWWLLNGGSPTTDTRKRFTASEGATAANRPKLVIVYEA